MHQQHILLAVLSVAVSWQLCISQYVYSGLLVRRPPPARRSAMEALERLRLPPARYFPQVDSQVPSYPGGVPPYQFYSNGEVYALPPQWTEEGDQGQQQEEEDEYQGSNYEYEEPFRPPIYRPAPPPFAQEIYPQESDIVGDMYRGENDFQHLPSWPMAESGEEETFVQRRNGPSYEVETNETATAQPLAQVPMTAIPSSPEKKNVKSLVLPDVPSSPEGDSPFRRGGQKEEPLFRPLQTSQRTTWETKNAINKSPIPLLKQMITSGPKFSAAADPLLEELNSLKKSHV